MIKTAIFDFDGTLADTIPLCREAFRRAVRELDGRTLTDEEIERQFGPDDLGVIQRLLPGKPELHEKGRELFLRYYRELHPELAPTPFPGAAGLLHALRSRGIRLAMVTGKRLESAEISLQFFHLAEFFPILETAPEGGVKPDRIRRALTAWTLPPGKPSTSGIPPRTWTHAAPFPSAFLPQDGPRRRM